MRKREKIIEVPYQTLLLPLFGVSGQTSFLQL
jgi:hypothetical protein